MAEPRRSVWEPSAETLASLVDGSPEVATIPQADDPAAVEPSLPSTAPSIPREPTAFPSSSVPAASIAPRPAANAAPQGTLPEPKSIRAPRPAMAAINAPGLIHSGGFAPVSATERSASPSSTEPPSVPTPAERRPKPSASASNQTRPAPEPYSPESNSFPFAALETNSPLAEFLQRFEHVPDPHPLDGWDDADDAVLTIL